MSTSHRPRKRFGQNFLIDPYYIQQIIACVQPGPHDRLVEIGPGMGALTLPLLAHTRALTVIEIDRDLIAGLQQLTQDYPHLQVISADALTYDFAALATPAAKLRIIGNLPYNITTPLLFHLLDYKAIIHDLHFMLQKEVVARISATPNHKAYGRLSVMMQYHFTATRLFDVPPAAFQPRPQVDSAFLRLTPHPQLPTVATDYALFADIVRAAFSHRRKVLSNCLKPWLSADQLQALGINPKLRPEQLQVADFVVIANHV